jgi:hypothetical protein
MVLAEENKFGRRATKKPYSVIMAETKIPKRKSNLALASDQSQRMTVTADVRNSPLPEGFEIRRDTPYIFSERLVSNAGGSNKHYFVRIYKFETPDGDRFAVVAYNAGIGRTLQKQEKGLYHNRVTAEGVAHELIRSKENGSSRYESARDTDEPPGRQISPNATGQRVTPGETRRSEPEPAPPVPEEMQQTEALRSETRRRAREDRRRAALAEQERLKKEEEELKAATEVADKKKRAKDLKDAIQKALVEDEGEHEEFIPEDEII